MQRKAINPWSWSGKLGIRPGPAHRRTPAALICSGQDAVGRRRSTAASGDMAKQLELALDNVEAVLGEAGMTVANVVRLNVYTTDVDELFKHWSDIPGRFRDSNGGFTTSVLGLNRLAAPQHLVLLEATAVD